MNHTDAFAGSARDLLWRSRWVVLTFIVSRVFVAGLVVLSQQVLAGGPHSNAGGLLASLVQWDGMWYLWIVRDGYFYTPGAESNVGFFPFFPLLVRLVFLVIGDLAISGVLVSNLCFLGAALVLQELIRLDYPDERVNRAATTFLMFSPVSFFFSSAYSESTFLFLAVSAFLAARKDHWLLACLCGACLSATRNIGMFIAIPLLIEFLRPRWRPEIGLRSLIDVRILWFALIPLGFAAFAAFCYLKLGDPFAYVKATAHWGRMLVPPWQTLANSANLPVFHRWLFGLVLAGGILVWISGFFLKLRPSYLVYGGVLITIYLCGNSLEGIPRYLSVVFPLFTCVGLLVSRFPWLYEPLLAGSCGLFALCTVLWANGYWMT